MIPRINRFHGLNALNPVYKHGKSYREGALALKVLPGKKNHYRLAVVVSKKVHKSAVVRNRIRRRLYEQVRSFKNESANQWSYDMILTCFDQRVAKQSPEDLAATLSKLLSKAKITTSQ